MVNLRRNAKADIIQELRYFSRCKLKSVEPQHTCTIRELGENLKMTPRDVIKNLKEMEIDGIIKKDKIQSPKFKARKRDVYTVIDRKVFESKDTIEEMNMIIDGHLDRMRLIAKKMRDRPAIKSINMLPFVKNPNNRKEVEKARTYQGKIDKKGQEYLEQFCEIVNTIFSFIDSMTYATYDDSLESNEKTERTIKGLRINTLNEITEVIEYIFKPYPARLQQAIHHNMIMRIPTYFMIGQLQKRSKLKF